MFCLFQWPVSLIHDSSSNASLSETLTQAFVYSCLFDLKRHLNHVGKWNSRLPKSRGPPSFLKGPESFGNSFQSLKSAMFDLQISLSLSLSLSINIYIYTDGLYKYVQISLCNYQKTSSIFICFHKSSRGLCWWWWGFSTAFSRHCLNQKCSWLRPAGLPRNQMILAPVKRWLEVTGDYRRIVSSGKNLFTYHTMLHRFFPPSCVYIHLYGLIFFGLLPALFVFAVQIPESSRSSLRCAHLLAHVITHMCRGDGLKDSRMGIAVWL